MVVAAHRPWALSVVVSESFLNGVAVAGIGDGIVVEPLRRSFQLPMMGPMDVTMTMTIVEVSFVMDPDHGGRLLATIRATGHAETHGDVAMPLLPGVARVRGDVLVHPVVELHEDGSFVAVLDVANSELVSMELEGIDGLVGADHEAQAQMSQMLFGAVGGELFEGLADKLGTVGLELDETRGAAIADLGVRPGPADVSVQAGHLVVGLPSEDGVEGTARPVEVSGAARLGVGVASGSLTVLVDHLSRERFGMPVPFDLEVGTTSHRVAGRIRNPRLFGSDRVPDLRPGLRYTVRPRLHDGRVELSLREAWVELPSVASAVTDPINRVNRWIGGVASRAPLSYSLPARISLPVRPESTATMRVEVVDIDVGDDGVHVTVDARL